MPKNGKDLKLMRVNANFPKVLVDRVKDYSFKLGVPTTQGYILLLSLALDYQTIIDQLPYILATLNDSKK